MASKIITRLLIQKLNLKLMKRILSIHLVILNVLLFANNTFAQKFDTVRVCKVHSISMNMICKEWDGQWQGITVASNGKCYFSSSTHSASHGAGFHSFNPETEEYKLLAEDMTTVCGESNTLSQQGKIHSPIIEHSGWLYFNTHLSNYWPKGIENYTGAHTIGYEISSGKFRDFGIIRERYSAYSAIGVDTFRNTIYTFVSPFLEEYEQNDGAHLFSIDINTGVKKDLGMVVPGRAACFWFFVDHEGNCWFTLWKLHKDYPNDDGNLYVYRPITNSIQTFYDVLPKGITINGIKASEVQNKKRAWTWASALPDKKKCLFTMGAWGGGDERLWLFDPSKDVQTGAAFEPIAFIGSTFLQTALGGDRLYFVQYSSLDDERNESAEDLRDRDPEVVGNNESLHLRSLSIKAGENRVINDHGKIVDQDGRAARMINSLAADSNGRVYMYGSWYVKSLKESSLQILFDKFPGQDIYKLMRRGEFFAFINTKDKENEH